MLHSRRAILAVLLPIAGVAHAQPTKLTVEAGKPVTLDTSAAKWTIPNRPTETGPATTLTFTSPGVRKITATAEFEVTVTGAAQPNPDPNPGASTLPPAGAVIIGNGSDLNAAARNGGTLAVANGNSYGDVTITKSGTSIVAYGDASKPLPRIGKITANSKSNLRFFGIQPTAFKLYNVEDVSIDGFRIIGSASNGINCEGTPGKRSRNVRITNATIADCYPTGSGHTQGIFASYTDELVIDGVVLDHNGWKVGQPTTATQYNHNIYIHSTCGPAKIRNVVTANAASHGIQDRSGGTSENILSIDNPIGMSFGLVNGSPCFPGGVSGSVTRFVHIGGRDIKGGDNAGKRGWAIELGNIKSATVSDVLIAHDNQNNSKAVHVARCDRLDNPAQYAGVKDLTLDSIYVWGWPPGPLDMGKAKPGEAGITSPKMNRVGIAPPVQANLRNALGADFMARARANPASAAQTGIAACRRAAGL